MKKLITTSLFSLITIYTFAQIVINRNDFGSIGDRLFYAIDSSLTDQLTPKKTGTNITWDMSTSLKSNYYDTTDFVDPSTDPDAPEEANLVIIEGGEPTYVFIDNAGVKVIFPLPEFIGGNTAIINLTKFPLAYGGVALKDSFITKLQGTPADFGQESLPFDSLRISIKVKTESEVDGWGTLILPNSSQDALRVKNTTSTTLKFEGKLPFIGTWINIPLGDANAGNQTVIAWYGKGKNYALVQAELDTLGNVASIRYQVPFTYPNGLAENSNNNSLKISVTPNPASENTFIQFESISNSVGSVYVYDITGKAVYTKDITTTVGKNSISIPVDSLQNGLYFTTITLGNYKASVKLLVQQ